jgi:hypothetical protein
MMRVFKTSSGNGHDERCATFGHPLSGEVHGERCIQFGHPSSGDVYGEICITFGHPVSEEVCGERCTTFGHSSSVVLQGDPKMTNDDYIGGAGDIGRRRHRGQEARTYLGSR